MAHLLSSRAAGRTAVHFALTSTDNAPKGFKPHPNPLPLNWGLPNHGFFPVDSIDVHLKEYPFQTLSQLPVTNASLENLSQVPTPPLEPVKGKSATVHIPTEHDDKSLIALKQGLQYSEVEGIPQLRQFTQDFVKRVHPPGYDEWSTIITNGAGDGLNKAADALLDTGDIILVEEFTFTPFLQNVKNAGGIPVPVKLNIDPDTSKSNGLDYDYLEELLANWDELRPEHKGKKPKALYTIATGQNPTGYSQLLEFRKKVYALAEKHDFAIIEDDPYGFLVHPPWKKPEPLTSIDAFVTVDEFLEKELIPSYVTIDTSGRVLRIETFSKLFAPGLRLGFIVAHKKIIAAIAQYAAVVTRSSSGTSQTLVNNIIQQKFKGVDGWLEWILKVKTTYSHRRDVLVNALVESDAYRNKYFDVIDPNAGMFVSIKINFPKGTDIAEKIDLLNWKATAYGVGVVIGLNMAVDKKFSVERGNFFRLSFAPANTDAELAEGGKRLSGAIKEFFDNGLEF